MTRTVAPAASEALQIVRPGMLTTIQDLGRPGFAAFGISPSGAMDRAAHRIANALVGNPPGAAGLELTGPGAVLRFLAPTWFAIAGADLGARLAGQALPPLFTTCAPAGAELAFTARQAGARVSLAVAGGFCLPLLLGSAATDLGGGLGGGTAGKPLRAGARLLVPPAAGQVPVPRKSAGRLARLASAVPSGAVTTLRYVPEADGGVDAAAQAAFALHTFRVSPRSSRVGYRFEGPALPMTPDPDRLSEPTAPGAIQLPPDGLPILLMADRNTTGGYPRLGHLVSADRSRAAQLWPGDAVRFVAVTLAAAVRAARQAETQLMRALAVELRPEFSGRRRPHASS